MDDEDIIPAPTLFLDPEAAANAPYPGIGSREVTFDEELDAINEAGMRTRHLLVAKYYTQGFTVKQIAEKLSYSPSAVGLILKRPEVLKLIKQVRDQLFDPDIAAKVKLAAEHGVDHILETIINPNTKEEIRSTNAKWAVEKVTGKPKQEVSLESNTLNSFIELMKEMKQSGELDTVDVTPGAPRIAASVNSEAPQTAAETSDEFEQWLDANL